jgi:isopenicillin N synthase-like dioxygenase
MSASHLVPTIDISGVTDSMLVDLDHACRDHGFFLLSGHGLDELIETTWERTRAFFESPRSRKAAIMRDQENPLGYFDRELTKRRRDSKEVFDFTDPRTPRSDARNRWPAEHGDTLGFRDAMVEFYDAFSDLAAQTTALVQRSIGLDPGCDSAVLDGFRSDRTTSSVRLNHYPLGDPVPEPERSLLPALGETALGYHTDPGVLTLLLQDDTGGLQARAVDGNWVDIEPIAGTIVVNLADAMQVWTNDQYVAAVHRVVPMTRSNRFSIPYFSNPPRDAVVEPIPALATAGARYRSFTWKSYMQARTDDNFTDLGADDTQISDYLVAP